MDRLTIFDALALTAMPLCHALEPHSLRFVLAFAVARLASSADRVLAGNRSFGLIELVWSGAAVRRRWTRRAAR